MPHASAAWTQRHETAEPVGYPNCVTEIELPMRLTTPQVQEPAQHVTHLRYRIRGRN
jgi:hypothetical protein